MNNTDTWDFNTDLLKKSLGVGPVTLHFNKHFIWFLRSWNLRESLLYIDFSIIYLLSDHL